MPVVQSIETPREQVRVSLHLDEARRRRGIGSWAEVARRCGIGPTPLSHLVHGKVTLSEVRLGTLARLCAVLGVRLDELVRIETVPAVPEPRSDRPITDDEFAHAVGAILAAPAPDDWVAPTEDDVDEAEPASVGALAARWRGEDTLRARFGLR